MRIDVENPMVVDRLWRNTELAELEESEYSDDEDPVCEVCEQSFIPDDLGEAVLASERWEDIFVCNTEECLTKHYKDWSDRL